MSLTFFGKMKQTVSTVDGDVTVNAPHTRIKLQNIE